MLQLFLYFLCVCLFVYINCCFCSLISVLAVSNFKRPYLGQTLNGRAGSPFNFTWTFSGVAGIIDWGIKESGVNAFTRNGKILSLKTDGQQEFLNSRYDGRVTGYRMSGQVVFTFNTINRSDMNTYLCVLRAAGARDPDQYDHVHLIVEGNHGWV